MNTNTALTPAERAVMIAASTARTAHHEAGHAVAVVARGGRLVEIVITEADPHHPDWDSEWAGFTRHRTSVREHPFTTFAGPWAEAMWVSETNPDTAFNAALDDAWENSADGDAAYYAELCEPVWEAARRAGLGFRVGAEWEADWDLELECLWPVICEVASMLLAGEMVTHEAIAAAIAAAGLDDEAVA